MSDPTPPELARMLAAQAPSLVRELLPGGRREGAEWRVGSVAGERGSSLSVRLHGVKAGVWSDFAGGMGGDLLDLIAATRCAGDLGEAMQFARAWLGISGQVAGGRRQVAVPPPATSDAALAEEAERKRRQAMAIWLEAAPVIGGTPVDAYLLHRGIDLRRLGRQPRALRFHSRLWCAERGTHLPAMVAAVVDAAGRHAATHRTWLARTDSGVVVKAHLCSPKKSLGSVAAGVIPLWRGASGKRLAEAPEGDAVALAEGIETALSVAIACPELRVLACVALNNFRAVELPAAIDTVVLCADHDFRGTAQVRRQRAALLADAVERWQDEGRAVRIARPPKRGADWNDVLTSSAQAASMDQARAA